MFGYGKVRLGHDQKRAERASARQRGIFPEFVPKEEIVKDESLQDDEPPVFLILQAWSNVNRERQSIAAELTNHVSLELIDSENLVRTVKSSGLVTNEELAGAYGSQALSRDMTQAYTKTRGSPLTWKNSNNVF
jgi:hypothetical protein